MPIYIRQQTVCCRLTQGDNMENNKLFIENRYMLSAWDKQDLKWIRNQFMKLEQINDFMKLCVKQPNRFERIEIFMEPTLNVKVIYENENNKEEKCTLRAYIFGDFYEENVSEYESNSEFRDSFETVL
jgi:hypothetical protein